MPPTSVSGKYRLRVEGIAEAAFGSMAFINETNLDFSDRSLTIFVQTDKPVYRQGQTGKIIIAMDFSTSYIIRFSVKTAVEKSNPVLFSIRLSLC